MAMTVTDIINQALRHARVLASGEVATGADAADTLIELQGLVNGLPQLEDGEWKDVLLTDANPYAASDGERIYTQGLGAVITLPTTYENDCRKVVPQRDLSRARIIGGDQAGLYVYSAVAGAWARVDNLKVNDPSPFSDDDSRGLAAMLAVAIAGEHGATITDVIAGRAGGAAASFQARFWRPITDLLEANFPAEGW